MGENSRKLDFIFKKLPGQKDPTGSDPDDDEQEQEQEELELNLNLGLSLGGRFGVDKNKLVRSSSIAAILPAVTDNSSNKFGSGHGFGSGQGLARTASLPVETEEEWRKRKEVQSLRRLAAKRRRSEKQKSLSKFEREEYVADMGRVGSSVGPGFGSGNWDFGGGGSGGGEKSDGGSVPGSFESQASTVSNLQGSSTEGEVSPASVQSSQERSNQDGCSSSRSKVVDPVVPPSRPKTENPSRLPNTFVITPLRRFREEFKI